MNSNSSLLRLMLRRLLPAVAALTAAVTFAACGESNVDDSGSSTTPTYTDSVPSADTSVSDDSSGTDDGRSGGDDTNDASGDDASEDPTAAYQADEAAFYARFSYLANAPTDLRQPEHDIFIDGVAACVGLTDGSATVESVVAALTNNRGLTDDGAHAVAGAATQVLCTDSGIKVLTNTERDAARIALSVGSELGVQVREEDAMVNTKLACAYLAAHGTAQDLSAHLRSEGRAFLEGTDAVTDQQLKVLVVDGVGIHCPASSTLLGPWWINV